MSTDPSSNPDSILGQEFLTWLWYQSDVAPAFFKTDKGEPFLVSMEKRITVSGGEGDARETASVSATVESPLREARMGLNRGKKVTRALVHLSKEELAFDVSLKADDFSLNSLKTPKIDKTDKDDDPDALFLEKVALIETGVQLLDCLYRQFLQLRFNAEAWGRTVSGIHDWMAGRLGQGSGQA
jgi:hypothetical protein